MFIEYQNVNFDLYDAIVAGSGPAGAMLTQELAARGKTVLVLETGGLGFDPVDQDRFATVQSRGHFDPAHWPSHWVRALGGTSAVWAGWVAPLSERNMSDWPVSRRDLSTWYRVAASELGRSATILDWDASVVPGYRMKPFSVDNPVRYGDAAGRPIRQHENVHVLLNATLAKLTPSPDRRGIQQITLFLSPDERVNVPMRREQRIVLAAGGLGNPQILLGSEDGSGAAVGNATDQVGRHLMEHPHMYGCATLVVRETFALPQTPESFGPGIPAVIPDDLAFSAAGPLDVSFELSNASMDENDAIERFVVDRLGGNAKAFAITARSEMLADPMNRVERIQGFDPSGLPRLRATCAFGADDLRSVLRHLDQMGQSFATSGVGRLQIHNRRVFHDVAGGGHIMGTTRMGEDPSNSVVDRNCRVHGYENLFVAGSSIFPSGGYANPTMTIMAFAARLADYLGT